MSHPRIEEVSDSDISDPSEGDIDDFDDTDILRRVDDQRNPASSKPPPPGAKSHILHPSHMPAPAGAAATGPIPSFQTTTDSSQYASYQTLYPVYFDSGRTRAEGRRVARSLAVANPLAREIVDACTAVGLSVVYEPVKTHPKDWANPGRVKVAVKEGLREAASSSRKGDEGVVKNKHHLYVLVALYLRAHPTTEDGTSLREPLRGAPPPPERGDPYPRPAVPRGWKMGQLLPYYSPAMTGGGVSENFFKDMMKEIQAGGGDTGGDMAGLLQQAAAAAGAGGASSAAEGGGGGKKGKKEKKEKGKGKG